MGSNSQIQCEIAVVMVQLRDGDPAIAHIYTYIYIYIPFPDTPLCEVLESQAIEIFFLEWLNHGWVDVNPMAAMGNPTEDGRDGQEENAKLPLVFFPSWK